MMISVCIPTYEMHGRGAALLQRSFVALLGQTHPDFEVIITDNSEDSIIENLCKNLEYISLKISYHRNPRKGMASNTNEGIKQAKGDLIKFLYMDDYLAHKDALKDIAENFTGNWLVTACEHDDGSGKRRKLHVPKWNDEIYIKNTIGSPSVLTIKNELPLLFDETMTWMLDCDYYKRLYDRYGKPTILDKVNIVIGTGAHQTTNHLSNTAKKQERTYMAEKYGKKRWFSKFYNFFKSL